MSPEQERDELQRELREEMGALAPTLGTPPGRVKWNAFWVWLGGALFGGASFFHGEGEAQALTLTGVVATVLCAAVAFGYEWFYWRQVECARAAKRDLDERRAASAASRG